MSLDVPLGDYLNGIGSAARDAARVLRETPRTTKDAALRAAARLLRDRVAEILASNAEDVADAQSAGSTRAMLDRLTLDGIRVEAMAKALEDVALLDDPVGRELARWHRPNGLEISRIATPIGVIAMIYESRPNVTADAAGLCLKSGNASILRGGSESLRSSQAIHRALSEGLSAACLPDACIQLVETTDRAAVGALLQGLDGAIDVLVPRGGRNLIDRVLTQARVPVLAHLEGICHVYVHEAAELSMARAIVFNSKMRRPGICGAAETLLIDKKILVSHCVPILEDLVNAGCVIRADDVVRSIFPAADPARVEDWRTEYLDAIISVRAVDGIEEALRHIETFGSHHTESIVTEDAGAARRFVGALDSAIVMWNASTQFADGGEFGMGAEIGIGTGKLHARGPVGVEQLTTFKYVVRGSGQTRQ